LDFSVRFLSKMACLVGAIFVFIAPVSAGSDTIKEIDKNAVYTDQGKVFSLSELFWSERDVSFERLIGKQIELDQSDFHEPQYKTNRYGDLRGKILVDGIGWLQSYWISRGTALWQGAGPYPLNLKKQLLEAERQAQEKKHGVWRYVHVETVQEVMELSNFNGFHIVHGKVVSVRKVRGTTYLNFGEDWRTDFTVAILPNFKRNFKGKDWNLDTLENKWISIRGQLRSYNGPYLELYYPEQVEFSDIEAKLIGAK